MSKDNEKKCNFKCNTCQHYDKKTDYCKEKEVEECSKKPRTDFSKCDSFLIRENLVMF